MKLVDYLSNVYGYDTPIFLKDVRIGRKSKAAVKEAFYRAVKRGQLSNDGPGVYSLKNKSEELTNVVTFEKIITNKFIYEGNPYSGLELFSTCGYYSGMTFLNQIGISEQVPAIPEITTNNTSSKKRFYSALGRVAIIRKAKTEVDFTNYKILQFLDMFHFVSLEEVKKNKELLRKYIIDNQFQKYQFKQYIRLYNDQTLKKIVEGGLIDAFM